MVKGGLIVDSYTAKTMIGSMGAAGGGMVAAHGHLEKSIMDYVVYTFRGADVSYFVTLDDMMRFTGMGVGLISAVWVGMLIYAKLKEVGNG